MFLCSLIVITNVVNRSDSSDQDFQGILEESL